MWLVLKRSWEVRDYSQKPAGPATIPAGRHEIERIPNPSGAQGYALVLKGTLVGAAEGFWRAHQTKGSSIGAPGRADWVVIEE